MSELKRNFTAAVDELNECLTLLKANESKPVVLPLRYVFDTRRDVLTRVITRQQ